MSGRDSGGDILDMAQKGTTVPDDSAVPRTIPSKPRPGEAADHDDPNQLGGRTLADAATNPGDIPRTTKDTAVNEVLTGTGDALPPQIDSKRMHNVPGGVTHDAKSKGSTRYTEHSVQQNDFVKGASAGAGVEKAPGQEDLTDEQAADKLERKEL